MRKSWDEAPPECHRDGVALRVTERASRKAISHGPAIRRTLGVAMGRRGLAWSFHSGATQPATGQVEHTKRIISAGRSICRHNCGRRCVSGVESSASSGSSGARHDPRGSVRRLTGLRSIKATSARSLARCSTRPSSTAAASINFATPSHRSCYREGSQ